MGNVILVHADLRECIGAEGKGERWEGEGG